MCGILGSVNVPFTEKDLSLLSHRGPDGQRITTLNVGDSTIYLGHTRLAIIDLSEAGNQPMFSNSGNAVIVYNGEVYNHRELRERLQGVAWRGHSDTETIVNYLELMGMKRVMDLNGIFAFAFVDLPGEKLYLVRDRFGVKPLYVWQGDNQLIFSSEIKPIVAIRGGLGLNASALKSFFTLRYNPSPSTLVEGVKKLKPGDVWCYDLRAHRWTEFMNMNAERLPGVKVERHRSEKYWIELLSEKLEEAVARQLLADVEVGVFLSGGIDSALITALAVRHSPYKIKTFTIGFQGASTPEEDETEDARATAQLLGTEHHEAVARPSDYLEFARISVRYLEEPNGTAPTFAQWEVARLASKYVKVALAGQGADELFLGYPRYRFAQVVGLLMKVRPLRFLIPPVNVRLRRLRYALGGSSLYEVFIRAFSVFCEDELQELLKVPSNGRVEDLAYFFNLCAAPELTPLEVMARTDTYTWLPDELLIYGDKMCMAHSVEMRVPFLDNEVVELVERMPGSIRLRRQHKYILKKVALKYLPPEIVYRPKRGFTLPILRWLREDLQEPLRRWLTDRPHPAHQFINPAFISKLLDRYASGKEKDHRKAIVIIHFALFLEEILNGGQRGLSLGSR